MSGVTLVKLLLTVNIPGVDTTISPADCLNRISSQGRLFLTGQREETAS